MRNKVIINCSILHEKPTGLGVYAKNVVQEINNIENNVEVLSPVEIDGVNTKIINKYVKPSYKKVGGLARFLWTQFALPFKGGKDDIIYHPFQYISILSPAKQIMTIHDLIPIRYPKVAKHQYIYYKYLMPILIKKSDKIICISESTKNDLIDIYQIQENKISVIYNGYDKNLFNKKNINRKILNKYHIDYGYMVMVGASYPHKNIEVAIKAFEEIDNCKLIIVGKDSSYILKLKALVKELNIEEKVKFVGYVPDEDLPTLYGCSKGFLYTTLYEGFGLPILEAMACGALVLCGNNSSLPEVYGDSALVLDLNNIDDVRAKIELAIKDNKLRNELLRRSEKNINKFSWNKTAREIYNVINKGEN